MPLHSIVAGVWGFTGLGVGRVYALDADDGGLWLVDGGMPGVGGRVLAQLRAAGHPPGAVRRILITHAHPDHTGSLPTLAAATGAPVFAGEYDAAAVEGRAPMSTLRWHGRVPLPLGTARGVPVARRLADGYVLGGALGGLTALFTPGHSPGHIAFYAPARRLLIAGDAITYRRSAPWLAVDAAQARASARRLCALDVAVLLLGHGAPITHGARAVLRALAARLDARFGRGDP